MSEREFLDRWQSAFGVKLKTWRCTNGTCDNEFELPEGTEPRCCAACDGSTFQSVALQYRETIVKDAIDKACAELDGPDWNEYLATVATYLNEKDEDKAESTKA